ncbi:MAG: transporter substrate-binding domain-containing protein [Angelakisella sp.]
MKRLISLMLVVALLCSLPGCSKSKDILASVKEAGVLRVLLSEDDLPYSAVDETGTAQGMELQLATRIAETIGVTLETLHAPQTTLLDTFDTSGAQLCLGRIPASDSLRYNYLTSVSYAVGSLYAVTPRGVYFPSLGSLSEKSVGVTQKLSKPALLAVSGAGDVTAQAYGDTGMVVENLLAGSIAAYLCYGEQANIFVENPALQVQDVLDYEQEQYTAVTITGANSLMTAVNECITAMIENGELAELQKSIAIQ